MEKSKKNIYIYYRQNKNMRLDYSTDVLKQANPESDTLTHGIDTRFIQNAMFLLERGMALSPSPDIANFL